MNHPGAIIAVFRPRGEADFLPLRPGALSARGTDLDRIIWLREPSEAMRRSILPALCPVVGEERVVSEDGLDLAPYEPRKPSCASEGPVVVSSFPSSSPGSSEAPLE